VFRLPEHLARFERSARAYHMELPCTVAQMRQAVHAVVRASGLEEAYIRPLAFRGAGSMAVDPADTVPDVAVMAWRLDDYFAKDGAAVRCTVSPWRRIAPGMLVPRAKAAGHYLNSLLAKAEARERGFDEAVLIDERGLVCEASAMNVFLVRDGRLITPRADAYLLDGITRDTVLELARHLGLPAEERAVRPEELAEADELFLTGTGARIAPVGELDARVYPAAPGPVTALLRAAFDEAVHGGLARYAHWLDPVAAEADDPADSGEALFEEELWTSA
jgi:branched-chain amino acid aminotransferase